MTHQLAFPHLKKNLVLADNAAPYPVLDQCPGHTKMERYEDRITEPTTMIRALNPTKHTTGHCKMVDNGSRRLTLINQETLTATLECTTL